jgi:hypothetical protein
MTSAVLNLARLENLPYKGQSAFLTKYASESLLIVSAESQQSLEIRGKIERERNRSANARSHLTGENEFQGD